MGIPNSFTPPGVYVNVTVNESSSNDNTFNVLVIGEASPTSAYANNPELYAVSTLTQLASDFGKDSDVYKIIKQYRTIDISTSIYALNCIKTNTNETTSNGNIVSINSILTTETQATDMAGKAIAATGGTGTGASFDVTSTTNANSTAFDPASVTISSAGVGYKIGDKLTIPNVGTITVTGVDSETVSVPQTDLVIIENALSNIGNMEFDIITGSYNSADAIEALDNYFTGTWGFAEELYGHYITIYQQNNITQAIKDAGNFNKETCTAIIIPTDIDSLTTLGSAVSQIALRTQENPSLPLRSFSLDVGTISIANRWDIATRNTLFANGFSTIVCDTAGNPTLERTRIGATVDNTGIALSDTTLETRFQAVYCAKMVRTGLASYTSNPRIIMNDDDVVTPSPYIVTPRAIRGTCIALYQRLISALVATDITTFKKNLQVSIDSSVPGRINVTYPITLASGLNQITINLFVSKS
ncbi:hypothetical protein KBX73_03025 [Acetobacter persici]|uniref:hypothetical protein n=1 Tax=Acetobacter persici TaxID=1076596 RepID=UPI0020CEF450|nr:hypothetical protein [Acetobacter persici]MCP9318764.1 hypothetical protein [Acetobacter persici]